MSTHRRVDDAIETAQHLLLQGFMWAVLLAFAGSLALAALSVVF